MNTNESVNETMVTLMALASQSLADTGGLDIDSFLNQHANDAEKLTADDTAELKELFAVMLLVEGQKEQITEDLKWRRAEQETFQFAVGLHKEFTVAFAASATNATVGDIFHKAETDGAAVNLPVPVVAELKKDQTPIRLMDLGVIKQIAEKVKTPWAALLKEVRRLESVQRLFDFGGAMPVLTRHSEESSAQQQQELLDQVRKYTHRSEAGK